MRETDFADRPPAEDIVLQSDGASAVLVPDAALLFRAEFLREGPDLVLSNADGRDVRVVDYFDTATPPDLTVPNGGTLAGAVVARLAGPEAPGAYAQAGAIRGAGAIGQVETLTGAASVQRADGTVEDLAVGVKIYANDVVTTEASSTCALTFVDGTIFTLASASRMVIDALIYDPEGSDNSATFNLVEGGFVFIAGQVAKTGGMDVTTPAATMGIRGTKVRVDISLEGGVATVEVNLEIEADGSWGRIELLDLSGNLLADIDTTETTWVVRPSEPAFEIERVPPGIDAQQALTIVEVASAAAQARVAAGEPYVPAGPSSGSSPEAPSGGDPFDTQVDETLGDAPEDAPAPAAPPAPEPPANTPAEDLEETPRNETRPPPVAPDDARLIDEDSTVTAQLAPGAPVRGKISFSLVEGPRFGEVVLAETGLYRYTPDPDYAGADSFTYAVTDTRGATDTGTVTVTVAPVNDAPTTEAPAVALAEDGSVEGVLTGEDIDGDPITFVVVSGPDSGALSLDETSGVFEYTPQADFDGTDAFVYVATDGSAASAPATVSVTVGPVNDAPVVADASASVAEDGAVTVTLAGADLEDDASGVALAYAVASGPAHGSVAAGDAPGSFVYTPDPDYAGADAFTVIATDSDGAASAPATVSVTVGPVNDAPVVADASASVAEDGAVTVTLAGADLEDDASGVALAYAVASGPAHGSVAAGDAPGSFVYTPDPDYAGADAFTVIATDSDGAASAPATVSVTVGPVNDAPVVADASASVAEDGAVTVTLAGADLEDDASGVALAYAVASGPAHGSVAAGAAPGSFVYTPDPDYAGADAFTVIATDSDGAASAPATVSVTVGPVNDAPVALDVTASGVEDTTITVTVEASDAENDAILYRVEAGPARGVVVPGSVAGTFLYTPEADFNGADSFTYVAVDAEGAESAVRTAAITVLPVNDAPVSEDAFVATGAGIVVTGVVTATDPDAGDLLRFSKGSDPSNGAVTVKADGSYEYTPASGFSGIDSFSVDVVDVGPNGEALSDTPVTVRISVAVGASEYVDADGRDLSLVIDAEGGGSKALPAGNVGIFTQPPTTTSINLAIVVDRSGSINQSDWNATLDAINESLQLLFDKYDGSRTDVGVQLITYSTGTSVLRPESFYDLQTELAALTGAIDDLKAVQPSGRTNFKAAFATTEEQLVMQGADEKAFVFFLSDGEPSTRISGQTLSDWETTTLASLKASIPDLTIEAFGVGDEANLDLLSARVDTGGEATALDTPGDLAGALAASALFSASLVSFSLRLLADGVDRGEIANEGDTDAFSLLGVDDYALTLANVDGIADLLGDDNVLQAETVFDVDGPDADGDLVTLVETGSIGVGSEAVDRSGTDDADVLFGSTRDDTLDGGRGNDLLIAGAGDDVLTGGEGVDTLLAGAGDDRLEAGLAEAGERYDGGAGRDVLALDNGDLLPSLDVAGIEAFDLENGKADAVSLTLADVLSFSDEGDADLETLLGRSLPESATIHGDDGDAITLVGADEAPVETVVDGGRTLNVYEFSDSAGEVLATLAIDQDVAVTVSASPNA